MFFIVVPLFFFFFGDHGDPNGFGFPGRGIRATPPKSREKGERAGTGLFQAISREPNGTANTSAILIYCGFPSFCWFQFYLTEPRRAEADNVC